MTGEQDIIDARREHLRELVRETLLMVFPQKFTASSYRMVAELLVRRLEEAGAIDVLPQGTAPEGYTDLWERAQVAEARLAEAEKALEAVKTPVSYDMALQQLEATEARLAEAERRLELKDRALGQTLDREGRREGRLAEAEEALGKIERGSIGINRLRLSDLHRLAKDARARIRGDE